MRRPVLALTLIALCLPAAWVRATTRTQLQGTWRPSAAELAGKKFPDEVRKSIKLVVKGDEYSVTVGTQPDRGTCKRNPSATPKALDLTGTDGPNKGRTILAIYERNGDTLRVCYDLSGKGRPKQFSTKEGTPLFLVTYKLDPR